MKMHLKKKTIAAVGAVLLLAVTYLVYSRPMTIQTEYPMLSIDKCTGIRGYYRDDTMNELQEFNIERSSEEFDKLWDLLYEREYRRSLKDLLPQGTRIYQTGPGDFQWEVYFSFDTVETPDGNGHSGTVLQFERWYDGALDIEVIGENHSYNTDDQDACAKEVLDIIRESKDSRSE